MANGLLAFVDLWTLAGLLTAAAFLTVGLPRVEPNARSAYVFRPLLVPGIVLLWPLVLWRWAVLELGRADPMARHDPPRRGHSRIWLVLGFVIPAVLLAGWAIRQDRNAEWPPPERLAPPPGQGTQP